MSTLIVMVHGWGAKRAVMWPIAYRLSARGYRIHHWTYGSLFQSIENHAQRLFDFLTLQVPAEPRIHLLAHSMGAIVVRAALNLGQIPNLGRFLLLAPPNSGTPVARYLSYVLGGFMAPTRELSDAKNSFVNQLPTKAEIESGIIAARYDLLVPPRNTHLPHERQHLLVSHTHNSLLLSRSVVELADAFFRTGLFNKHNEDSESARQPD